MSDYLIVGLGNPGRHYRGNRHNAGYMLIDRLLEAYSTSLSRSLSEALVAVIEDGDHTLVLAKPQTYVNESGRSVASLLRAFGLELPSVLVAFDELDLQLGTLRMPPGLRPAADHVLSNFGKGERSILTGVLKRAVSCVQQYLDYDIQIAMTACNQPEES